MPTTSERRPGGAAPAAEDPRLASLLLPRERARPTRNLADTDSAGTMKIGEVAERVGLSLRTLRYYEESRLITPAGRTAGGFRLYSERDVQRLLLIMQMKPLGFSLERMRQVAQDLDTLAGRGPRDDTGVADARRRLESVRVEVEERYAVAQRQLQIAGMFRDHLAGELQDLMVAPEDGL